MIFDPTIKMIPDLTDPMDCLGQYFKYDLDKLDEFDEFNPQLLLNSAFDIDCTDLTDSLMNMLVDPNSIFMESPEFVEPEPNISVKLEPEEYEDVDDEAVQKAFTHDHNYTNKTFDEVQTTPVKRKLDEPEASCSSKRPKNARTTSSRPVGRPRKCKDPPATENRGSDVENQYTPPMTSTGRQVRQPRRSTYYNRSSKASTSTAASTTSKRGTSAKRDHKEMERMRRKDMKKTLDALCACIPIQYVKDSRGRIPNSMSKAKILKCSLAFIADIMRDTERLTKQTPVYERKCISLDKELKTFAHQDISHW